MTAGLSGRPILVPTRVAACAADVTPATIRDWHRRGIITPAGGSPRRPLWDLYDIRRAVDTPKPRRGA